MKKHCGILLLGIILGTSAFCMENKTTDEMTKEEWVEAFINFRMTGSITNNFSIESCKQLFTDVLGSIYIGLFIEKFSDDKTRLDFYFDGDKGIEKQYLYNSDVLLKNSFELLIVSQDEDDERAFASIISNHFDEIQTNMGETLEQLFLYPEPILICNKEIVCLKGFCSILLNILNGKPLGCLERRIFISIFVVLWSKFSVDLFNSEEEIEKMKKKSFI